MVRPDSIDRPVDFNSVNLVLTVETPGALKAEHPTESRLMRLLWQRCRRRQIGILRLLSLLLVETALATALAGSRRSI
jgi:hypothetical protein